MYRIDCTVPTYGICCTVRIPVRGYVHEPISFPILEENPPSASPLLRPLVGRQECPFIYYSCASCQSHHLMIKFDTKVLERDASHPRRLYAASQSKSAEKQVQCCVQVLSLPHHETSPPCTAACRLKSARWLYLEYHLLYGEAGPLARKHAPNSCLFALLSARRILLLQCVLGPCHSPTTRPEKCALNICTAYS
jgi:hypothetical protein